MKERPGPVTVTRPDGSRFTVPGSEYKQRAAQAAQGPAEAADTSPDQPEEMTPAGAVTLDSVEELIFRTLSTVMRTALAKPSEKIAAATAAIKLLAIKYKVGEPFGGELDD